MNIEYHGFVEGQREGDKFTNTAHLEDIWTKGVEKRDQISYRFTINIGNVY